MMMVSRDLIEIGVFTVVKYGKSHELDEEEEMRSIDLILDYYRLPRDRNPHLAYEAVTDALEQGIGLYKARQKQAFREIFNPIIWLAYLIRLPITVMERAGMLGHEKTKEMALRVYGRIIQIMITCVSPTSGRATNNGATKERSFLPSR
jgi:hypothetical protein